MIYRPAVVEGFEWVQPVDQEQFDLVYQLDGAPRALEWEAPVVTLIRDVDDGQLRPADTPWLGQHALVFRDQIVDQARHALASAGEFLQLTPDGGGAPLWLFNVTTVLNALDLEASELDRFPSSGRVMRVRRHVFRPDVVDTVAAFKVPEVRTLFLSDGAVAALSQPPMAGLRFELVSERGG